MKLLSRHLTTRLLRRIFCVKKANRRDIGKAGESLACRYLRRCGYIILEKNYATPLGEIDIIAEDGATLVFLEVKMRHSDSYGLPEEAINSKKMQRLTRLARLYIKRKNLYNRKARFDVVSILSQRRCGKKTIRLIKNAFEVKE